MMDVFLGVSNLFVTRIFSDRYEVSYFVCHDEWGEGIATEAVSLALDTAFEKLGASRVDWAAHVGNWGSWKAAWKNGFRKEGVARLPGYEAWVGGILATDPRTPALRGTVRALVPPKSWIHLAHKLLSSSFTQLTSCPTVFVIIKSQLLTMSVSTCA